MKKFKSKSLRIVTLVLLVVLLIGVAVLLFRAKNQNEQTPKQQLDEVINHMKRHVILPEGEDPTLATVGDSTQIKDPYLKKSAKNGDKVLLYYKAKKVYVYRPSDNLVVDIYPLILDASAAQSADARILVRSGNSKLENAEEVRQKIKQSYSGVKLLGIEPATRQDYPNTIVIDLTEGTKYEFVSHIIELLGARRGILPSSEPAPENADILIITGVQ